MSYFDGSVVFRYFSYAFMIFLIIHVVVQGIITKLFGPFGKKSTHEPVIIGSPDENLANQGFNQTYDEKI